MNLFDCQLLSNPSMNHSYRENQPNFEGFDHLETLNPHSDSVNESSVSAPEVSSSPFTSNTIQKNPEKRIQRAIYKGPDVFGKVLGPTADESILVGLQALMDMAGNLEFANFTPSPSTHDTPEDSPSKESREASEPISQSSASCQCYVPSPKEKSISSPECFSEEIKHDVVNEVRQKPCKYIITQENIAAVNARRSKCQHSQTRVLPSSMTCYNPDAADYPRDRSTVDLPCPNLTPKFQPPLKCQLRTVNPPVRRARQLSPTMSPTPSSNCPCSQFYRQMTTISVLENSPEDSPTCLPCTSKSCRTPCQLIEQPTLIFPKTVDAGVDAILNPIQVKKSVASEPTKETTSITIQTLPLPRPNVCNVKIETESVVSQEKSSVACDCNFCIPISAGVSKPPSRVSNVCKNGSSVRFAEEVGTECMCSACCVPREKLTQKTKDLDIRKNKSCTCSLIPKGVRVVDAAISCLKVNTSCQYYRSEITPIESRSTQCGKLNHHRRDSCIQICSESGDCRPQRKKSVRILGGPYECPDSETRYFMEPNKSISRSVLPLLDCDDEISKLCYEKPARVCLEMGDSFIPPPMEVRYAITKITKFRDFSTFEVMKSTSKKPKCMPKAVEGVFVLKKEENYCSSKTYE